MTVPTEQLRRLRSLSKELGRIEDEAHLRRVLEGIESPLELYYVPWLLNWDDSWTEKAIRWILGSSLCDAGTALAIYWLAAPADWMAQEIDDNRDDWDNHWIAFFRDLERRIRALDFPSQEISYDPKDDRRHWNSDGSERIDLSGIPEWMKVATPGSRPPSLRELKL